LKPKAPRTLIGIVLLTVFTNLSAAHESLPKATPPVNERSRLKSEEFSRDIVARKPEVQVLLNKLRLRYVHELDPSKVYSVNRRTGKVSVVSADSLSAQDQKDASPNSVIIDGFATLSSVVSANGTEIVGLDAALRQTQTPVVVSVRDGQGKPMAL